MRERNAADEEERQARQARAEAEAFVEETEDYEVCQHNSDTIARYMQVNGWAATKKNFAIAWERLKAAGLVVVKKPTATPNNEGGLPSQTEEGSQPDNGGLPAQTPVTTRQRGEISSTGIRAGDSSGEPGTRKATPKYTAAQIQAMPREEYRHKYYNEPGFKELVDKL